MVRSMIPGSRSRCRMAREGAARHQELGQSIKGALDHLANLNGRSGC